MLTILHASDLQNGKPYRPWAGEALVEVAARIGPDLIVVAGDLTQRAKAHEFREARRLLERMPKVPLVVTPGNHDVPLYRVWERLFAPYRNWRRFVSRELDTVTHLPGTVVVALNSASPYRGVVGGWLGRRQLDLARSVFEGAGADEFRVLVTHHHFVSTPAGEGGRPLPRSRAILELFEACGIDLVLGGHVHQTHFATSRDVLGENGRAGVPILACGTTTSRRGRGRERGVNSLNLIRVGDQEIEVVPHLLRDPEAGFRPGAPVRFPRWRVRPGPFREGEALGAYPGG